MHTNRLIGETSPYLLQHAHNPVNWYPWGNEALERARQEDRLILLSIGYAACHWCHVMERESFEDDEIAAIMNQHFVNIKVDREERPDLDEIYMAATMAMNQGQGGWPMTVFLTPDLEPVFAGTYFPAGDAYGRPGFPTVLNAVAAAWRDKRASVRDQAQRIADHLRNQTAEIGPAMSVGEAELERALDQYWGSFDSVYGGFGSAPKFPPATGLSLLLRLHDRLGDSRALDMVCKTLDCMGQGGIYDHVGGGFARYSTDRHWLVPHFEKMLYDNALLSVAYLEAYQVTQKPDYRRVAEETLDYVLREMTDPGGGFYSSTDADSEGQEGKFFVWTPDQIAAVLDREAARVFCTYYDVTPAGNWEGRSVLNVPRDPNEVARELGMSLAELMAARDDARRKVYAARLERVAPGLDDKVLTARNGLMISALAAGYRTLGDRRYLLAATRAADFVLGTLSRPDGGLLRTYRAGQAKLDAYLADYAYLSEALIDLYEAGGQWDYLWQAERLLERVVAEFVDPESGACYNTSRDHEKLLMRYRDGADGATPAPNAVAASALARASYHLARDDFRTAARRSIEAYGSLIARFPSGFARSLMVVDLLLEGPVELALVGQAGSADLEQLRREVVKHYLPRRIEALGDPSGPGRVPPLLEHKTLVDGKAALYVCRNFACQAPVSDPQDVAAALDQSSAPGA